MASHLHQNPNPTLGKGINSVFMEMHVRGWEEDTRLAIVTRNESLIGKNKLP
jgi:hypothetical protein